MSKKIHIIGGGTVSYIRNHLALAAPAYGRTAIKLWILARTHKQVVERDLQVELHLTKMAGGDVYETPQDIEALVHNIVDDPDSRIVFFNVAMVDYKPQWIDVVDREGEHGREVKLGKYEQRLSSRQTPMVCVTATTAEKIVQKIRKHRKDLFLVAFKTTCGATPHEQYLAGLNLLKEASCNLVVANDTKTRNNMIITPEEAVYNDGDDRDTVLSNVVDMAILRSHLHFTQSTVIAGEAVSWADERVPASLRTVVNHCIDANAYKPFRGATVGHFAVKVSDTEFLTSIRKSDFNKLDENGLVYVKTDGPDTVLAYGAKPSVGGQSQRRIFRDHEGMDCIVHFHCPLREHQNTSDEYPFIPVRSQREVECGSHECGQNTSEGLGTFDLGNNTVIKAVHLDKHGPNIVFSRDADPDRIIAFIKTFWDLSKKTGGYSLPKES